MGIPEILDAAIRAHGNRDGLSHGWLAATWLTYILSEADHRMAEVETWADRQMETLSILIPQSVQVKDFTDDRLAALLRKLGDDVVWDEVETRLGQHLVQVYDLKGGAVRLDSTAAAVYHNAEGQTLFRYGQSKDHRPDLAQFKVMLASLDPLGLPLATLAVPGNEADDGLYLPAIAGARKVVGQGGRLYIGDAKMAALATRAFLQSGGDYYLTPLPLTGEVPELLRSLLEPVWRRQQPLERIYRPVGCRVPLGCGAEEEAGEAGVVAQPRGKKELLALGFETLREQQGQLNGVLPGERLAWQERVLVIYSPSFSKKARQGLRERLGRAEQALLALTPPRGKGRRQKENLAELQAAAQAILKKQRVAGLVEVSYSHETQERQIRQYGDRPGRLERQERYVIQVRRNQEAIVLAQRQLGWRLYVSNAPQTDLSLPQAVWAYRGAPAIERSFHRLKGHPLGIRPLYVQREDHVRGLVRLLSLGLRVLTLVEHVVRESLNSSADSLSGLYAGNPKRESARPTTERLLEAFDGINLTTVRLPEQVIRHVTVLSPLQQRILTLLGLPTSIYEELAQAPNPIPP